MTIATDIALSASQLALLVQSNRSQNNCKLAYEMYHGLHGANSTIPAIAKALLVSEATAKHYLRHMRNLGLENPALIHRGSLNKVANMLSFLLPMESQALNLKTAHLIGAPLTIAHAARFAATANNAFPITESVFLGYGGINFSIVAPSVQTYLVKAIVREITVSAKRSGLCTISEIVTALSARLNCPISINLVEHLCQSLPGIQWIEENRSFRIPLNSAHNVVDRQISHTKLPLNF